MARKFNIDDIAEMSDDELSGKLRSVRTFIARNEGQDQNPEAEIDLCYFQREVEIRQNRRKAHDEWLKNHRFSRQDSEVAAS